MTLLSIDTTTPQLNLSLFEEEKPVLNLSLNLPKTERMVQLVRDLMAMCGVKPEQLKALAVVTGPGSYTSIRAGIIMVKTIGQHYDLPIISLNKSDLYVYQFRHLNTQICPIVDIRQKQVYTSIGKYHSTGIEYKVKPKIINLEEWKEELLQHNESLTFVGDKVKDFNPVNSIGPNDLSTRDMGKYSHILFQQKHYTSFKEVNPFYPRSPVF